MNELQKTNHVDSRAVHAHYTSVITGITTRVNVSDLFCTRPKKFEKNYNGCKASLRLILSPHIDSEQRP